MGDKINSLIDGLKRELKLRELLYEAKQDQLLGFDDVEWKSLGDVVELCNGKDWRHLKSGTVPVYGSGGLLGYVDQHVYDGVSVLIPRKGAITNVFYVDTPFWNIDTIFYTKISSVLNPRYFYYFICNCDLKALSDGISPTRPSLTKVLLNTIKIPIPSLEDQQRVVEELDSLTTNHYNTTESLEAEIKNLQEMLKSI